MRIIAVSTAELDSPKKALSEIQAGIEAGGGLARYSVGIASCVLEFVDTGLFGYFADNLKFPLVGVTTTTTATRGRTESFQFSLLVLTSDEKRFGVALSAPLGAPEGTPEESALEKRLRLESLCHQARRQAAEGLAGEASYGIAFLPSIKGVSDENLAKALFGKRKLPIFGCLPVDNTQTKRQREPQVLFEGEAYQDRVALLINAGGKAAFFFSDIFKDNIARQKAIVTKAEGNVAYQINDAPVLDYFQTLGMVEKNILISLNSNPLILHARGVGGYIPRVAQAVVPGGGVLFNGEIFEGATVSLGLMEPETVIASTEELCARLKETPGAKGALLFGCLSRQLNLGVYERREIEVVDRELLEESWPWLFAYGGGEMCPFQNDAGETQNAFYNLTAVALAFLE
ncbi:MAG: FIST C-terminal domain-containing protein [Deltaproteobacteria bacterium]|jgi:hypothetical protein|nr:FIST C-terminal domain-containing protein [Deltaproteobacteria bacterium]